MEAPNIVEFPVSTKLITKPEVRLNLENIGKKYGLLSQQTTVVTNNPERRQFIPSY